METTTATTTERLAFQAARRIDSVHRESLLVHGGLPRATDALERAAAKVRAGEFNGAFHSLEIARRQFGMGKGAFRSVFVAKVARLEGYVSALGAVAAFEYDGARLTIPGI